jgi:hypothetical protein
MKRGLGVYLMKLSVAQKKQGDLLDEAEQRDEKEVKWRAVRETTININKGNQCPDRDSNRAPS